MEVRKMFLRKKKQNDFVTGAACAVVAMRILSDPAAIKLLVTYVEAIHGSQTTNDSGDRDTKLDPKDN